MDNASALRRVSWLSRALPESIDFLARRAATRAVPRGTFVFHQGQPSERLYVILSGTIAAVRTADTGGELILRAAQPFETAGAVDLTAGSTYDASARALAPSTLLAVSTADVRSVIGRDPQVALDLVSHLSDIVRAVSDALIDVTFLDLSRRLAGLLLRRQQEDAPPVTQGDLARLLSAARQSVNRSLADLARSGYVTLGANGTVTSLDVTALQSFVQGDRRGDASYVSGVGERRTTAT